MQAALQERPEILKAVRVFASIYILDGMVNDLVLVFLFQTPITMQFVGKNGRASSDMVLYQSLESFARAVWNYAGTNLAAALKYPHDGGLVCHVLPSAADATRPDALVHVPSFAADEGFVNFDFST